MKKLSKLILTIILVLLITKISNGDQSPQDLMKTVIIKINKGDRYVLRNISYQDLEYALDLARQAFRGKIPFDERGKIVNSALKGLFNKDPRVKLICIQILKQMKPDRLMEFEVQKAFQIETGISSIHSIKEHVKFSDFYDYRDLTGIKVRKSLSEEITKLYKFVQRHKLMYRIIYKDYATLKSISKNDFYLLTKPIDNEKNKDIPFRSFNIKGFFKPIHLINVIQGLDNPVLSIKQECANYLINYYNYNAYNLSVSIKNKITLALKKAYDDDIIPKPKLVKVKAQ
ncbi:MAG: hypothetical protein OEV44_04650 [Spirochaetota bacterium]|nr:hypothetical protein [Spirochaetota bacterium]